MYNSAQQPAPPVNNLLQPDIYNRLDAEAIERTRVINTQLDERLRAQQNLLAKYRLAAERFHRREKDRVRAELRRISNKLPAVSRIRDFRSKFLYGDGLRKSPSHSLSELPARKIRGVPEERASLPFCERFFIHHLHSKKKYYRAPTPSPPLLTDRTAAGEVEGGGNVELPSMTVDEVSAALNADVNVVDSGQTTNDNDCKEGGLSVDVNSVRSPVDNAVRTSPARVDHSPPASDSHSSKTLLPPIRKQNVRLARSSPQLFHG